MVERSEQRAVQPTYSYKSLREPAEDVGRPRSTKPVTANIIAPITTVSAPVKQSSPQISAGSALSPAAEIAASQSVHGKVAASSAINPGSAIQPAPSPEKTSTSFDAAPLESLSAFALRDLGEAGRSDFSQALAATVGEHAPPGPPVTTPEPRALQTTDFLSMIRIQKTASKTLQGILMWLAADAFSRGNKRSTRNRCATSYFSTSDVPLATEVQAALDEAGEAGRSDLLADPFAAEADKLKPPAVSEGGWPSSLADKWYKGAPLPGRKDRACASFDEGQKAVRGTHCPFLHAQHMHIADVEGGLAKFKRLGIEKVRLVAAVRHPTRRVQSEFKHVANHGPGLWDYCHVAQRQKLQGGYRSAKFGAMTLTDFLAADAHAFGMRNRQVKMISGLATEPVRALPAASWSGYPADDTGRKIIKAEHHQAVGAPTKEYQQWAADALALAKWRLATMEGVLVAERLAESLAVIMVHFEWVPLLGDKSEGTPRGAVVEPTDIEKLRALLKKRAESPGAFKRPDVHVLTLGLEKYGKNLDFTVHVDWASCGERFERVKSSAEKWGMGGGVAAAKRQLAGAEGDGWGPAQVNASAAGEAAAQTGTSAEGEAAAPEMPETAAGLSAWDMLVCVSSHMADQFREMDRTDKLKLDFPVEGQLQDRLLALNELDSELHAYAVQLLDARVQHAKGWLQKNPDWIKEAVQWGNAEQLPASPVGAA